MVPKTMLGRDEKWNEIYYAIPLMTLKNTYTHRKHNISEMGISLNTHLTKWLLLWEREKGEKAWDLKRKK